MGYRDNARIEIEPAPLLRRVKLPSWAWCLLAATACELACAAIVGAVAGDVASACSFVLALDFGIAAIVLVGIAIGKAIEAA